jgi:D-alanyl-D-alanine carboxypeptidase
MAALPETPPRKEIARLRVAVWVSVCIGLCGSVRAAAPDIDSGVAARVDAVATEWLASTAAPSVSIAIVRHGAVTYAKAYGEASILPPRAAAPASRYALDSVTKEFTATAILLLAEQGKLSLDDPLRRWFPNLGAAGAATLRQVLTHTSGIRDYWPQDFLTPEMTRPTTSAGIVHEWASRPLDFEPGSEWQYSNTGFVLAAAVVERVSGEDYFRFLQHYVFEPLKMTHVADAVMAPAPEDAAGYTRYGLGPPQSAPKEGTGWLFGAANLVMSPSDLARWDLSLMNRSLLQPASYDTQFTPMVLKSGTATSYGLGLDIEQVDGSRRIGHSGGGSGFLAENRLWPAEHIAIVVLTNGDWAAPSDLSDRIAFLLVPPSPAAQRARDVFAAMQSGSIDRTLFTEVGNIYLNAAVVAALHASLAPLGPMRFIELERESKRGGLITRRWKVICAGARLEIVERGVPGGKLEQFLVLQRQD